MDDKRYRISVVNWADSEGDVISVRRKVFIEEQNVPEEIEIDGADPDCFHLLVRDVDGCAVGTARLDSSGRIGRMAVTIEHRGRGIGSEMLARLIELGRARGIGGFHLHAQVTAVDFYRRAGFVPIGDEFEEAGITHISMTLGE